MLANSLLKSALLLQRVSALKQVSVCVRCCANQSEHPPSSSFADAAKDQRGHAVLQFWCVRWAQDVIAKSVMGLQFCTWCPTLSSDVPPLQQRRLGEGYATAGPCEVDESKKRIWYAGGSEVDKVGCRCQVLVSCMQAWKALLRLADASAISDACILLCCMLEITTLANMMATGSKVPFLNASVQKRRRSHNALAGTLLRCKLGSMTTGRKLTTAWHTLSLLTR